jgi:hypothetical protein
MTPPGDKDKISGSLAEFTLSEVERARDDRYQVLVRFLCDIKGIA